MLGISGGDPVFRDDDGSASPEVSAALAGFAAGQGSEHSVLIALADSRLLVPVLAVLTEPAVTAGGDEGESLRPPLKGEKASEMAMPTLVGLDGRRAVPAFTGLDALKRWQPDARPVPVAALGVWQTACEQDAAVVVDVGGPVPLAIEGSRLAALARGDEPPLPEADPDVYGIVADVLAGQLAVSSFELEAGDQHDLGIVLTLTEEALTGEALAGGSVDLGRLGGEVVDGVMARLGGRLKRGVAIWLNEPTAAP